MEQDFLKVYNTYKNDIYRLCYSYTKNITDAEDLTQDVFLKYYKYKDKVEDLYIKNWLIKVAINECKSFFLSSWYKRVRFLNKEDENAISYKENNNDVLDSIFQLPKKERLIVHLYYYEDYNIKDIAKMLRMSETNVKVKLHRSRRQLKNILEEENE